MTYTFLDSDDLYDVMEEHRQICGKGKLSLEMWHLSYP